MPIDFRCAFCNQLMRIGRRKAGTVVRCPKCKNDIVVPKVENGAMDGPEHSQNAPPNPQAGDGGLFEQSDFEKVFGEGTAAGPQMLQPPKTSGTAPASPWAAFPNPASPGPAEYEAVPLGPVKNLPRGVFVTSGVLAAVSAVVVVLMGMAFFLGLLLGRSPQP